jgi:PhzF family phenazine biosynthesis protein
MAVPIYLVDAFTDRPFTGNPAGVCFPEGVADERWMQQVASEMNQAETAFAIPRPDGSWRLRWFTPTMEVDLCGHATLATAHTLWQIGRATVNKPILFHTRSGILTCMQVGENIEMDFPSENVVADSGPQELQLGLGVTPKFIGKNRMDYLVELADANDVVKMQPDMDWLSHLPCRGVIVTAKSNRPDSDFISRFFAPQSGVNEDPVTGSAHCALGPYWQSIIGRSDLIGYQASRRGGFVKVKCLGPRVLLGGKARTVVAGTLV